MGISKASKYSRPIFTKSDFESAISGHINVSLGIFCKFS